MQVIDYQNQRYRLLKQVATAYAIKFSGSWINRRFDSDAVHKVRLAPLKRRRYPVTSLVRLSVSLTNGHALLTIRTVLLLIWLSALPSLVAFPHHPSLSHSHCVF